MTDIWAELGIGRTVDTAAIRRAYAARIKTTRPDADPQGFARLRTAYERALAAAKAPSKAALKPAVAPPVPSALEAAMPAPVVPASPAVRAVTDCVRRGDVVAAADRLAEARAAGALSLEETIRLADQLGWSLAQDRSLSADAVGDAAARLGWGGDDTAGPWAKALRARLDAERWLEVLRKHAKSRWLFLGAAHSLAARIMLGRGKLRTVRSMGRDPTLRRRYGEFLLHAPVVGDQFDPVRIAGVEKMLAGPGAKPPSVLLLVVGVAVISWAFGHVAAEVEPLLQDPVAGMTMAGLLALLFTRRVTRRVRAHWQRRRRTEEGQRR